MRTRMICACDIRMTVYIFDESHVPTLQVETSSTPAPGRFIKFHERLKYFKYFEKIVSSLSYRAEISFPGIRAVNFFPLVYTCDLIF